MYIQGVAKKYHEENTIAQKHLCLFIDSNSAVLQVLLTCSSIDVTVQCYLHLEGGDLNL